MALADLYSELQFIVQVTEPAPSHHLPRPSTSHRWRPATPCSLNRASTPCPKPSERRQQLSSRIIVQQRAPGTPQTVHGAAVYILHLPSASPGVPKASLLAQITDELRAHIGVLRANKSATLVLTARLLPEPGTMDPSIEAIGRLRDLSVVQLANEPEIEALDVMDMLNNVRDETGRLILVNNFRSRHNPIAAFEIRCQAYTDRHEV